MKNLVEFYLMLFRFWMKFPEKLRFLLVGGYNTVVSYFIYVVCLYVSEGNYPQVSLFLSFLISSVNSYVTQKFYVFNTRGNYVREYILCLASWGVSYIANAGLLLMFTSFFSMNPYVAQIFCLIIVAVLNYILLKYIAFYRSFHQVN